LHRVGNFAAHLLRSGALGAQHLQHLIEGAGYFPHPHQGYVHCRKQGWMSRQRVGKAVAAEDRGAQGPDHPSQTTDVRIAGEQFERIIESGARLQQQSKITGERCDFGGTRPIERAPHPG
jgi:hypothetical protein